MTRVSYHARWTDGKKQARHYSSYTLEYPAILLYSVSVQMAASIRYSTERQLRIAIIASALAFALALFALVSCSSGSTHTAPPVRDGVVAVKAAELAEGKPVFFTLAIGGDKIGFFIVRIDGKLESYLDACRKCYPYKKGYRVDGTALECVYCGVHYPMKELKGGLGSCSPVILPGGQEGGEYLIPVETIRETWQKLQSGGMI
jgi:uncharacterized membrane protein